jgi:predicted O-methyltransferase YrrM
MTESETFRQQFKQHHSKESADTLMLSNIAHLERLMKLLPPNARGLEIGCFKGGATVWFLEHGIERMTVIDTFEGSPEHQNIVKPGEIRAAFDEAVKPYAGRVAVSKGKSSMRLPILLQGNHSGLRKTAPTLYDFIYVDGSHDSVDVVLDAILAFKLLKPGGVMCFDDYEWCYYLDAFRNPKPAIDFFLASHEGKFTLLEKHYQVSIRKL